MDYTIIRSSRKTLSIEIRPEGVLVRAPMRMPETKIDEFVASRRDWIEEHTRRVTQREERLSDITPMTQEELRELANRALEYIPKRVAHYAPIVGVKYGRITIRDQRTRWGSCSSKGNLNFNCLLMLAPPRVADSVVVHELCHLIELNHSKAFYDNVLRVMPDYFQQYDWLKRNGESLMRRLPQ